MAKLYTGELSHRVVNHALQIHGGYGFMDEFPISRLYRDQKILEIGEGTNEVQRMVIAKHLGLYVGLSSSAEAATHVLDPHSDAAPRRCFSRGRLPCSSPPPGASSPPRAAAHVTVSPPFVEAASARRSRSRRRTSAPPQRRRLPRLEAPPGIELASAAPPPGWSSTSRHVARAGRAAGSRAPTSSPSRSRSPRGRAPGPRPSGDPALRRRRDVAGTSPDRPPGLGRRGAEQHLGRAVAAGSVGLVVIAGSSRPRCFGACAALHFKRDSGTGCYRRAAVIFHQFLNDDLGCASYLVGGEEAGIAVVVDPPFAIEPCSPRPTRLDVRIVRTIETHTHADHVSGHGRLALEHGIPVSIHPAAEVDYPHDPMDDGDEIEVGAVTLRVHPHAGPPAGALLPRRDRHDARRRAVARAHGRLALRRRRRPARPRRRRDRGRRGPLPLAPAPARAPRRRRGVPRATSPARSAASR